MNVDKRIVNAKPFVKWAGGKGQLLTELFKQLPAHIRKESKIDCYVEPFVGGGALFFYLKSKFDIKEAYLIDINPELIIGYKVVKNDPRKLIRKLMELQEYYKSKNEEERKKFYYQIRSVYNKQSKSFDYENYNEAWVERAALLIFLNKTCYNGLFRQNKKGEFNVPFGGYRNPKICDSKNIIQASNALKDAKVICGDFSISERFIEKNTFVYLDPPYRPLNKTSSFTDYSKHGFTEKDQIRLAEFFRRMDEKGAYLMLSNSDPKNTNPDDDFFKEKYAGYKIKRVLANRAISCIGDKRGPIYELIITNY